MPQRASVFCNFYIRVDREALVSERALDVGSVAFKAMSTKSHFGGSSSCFLFSFYYLWIFDFETDYILFFLQIFITNYLRHVKKPGRNFK
jgi:hypothetical protein